MTEVAVPSKVPTPPSQGAPRRDKILALNEEKGIYKFTVKYTGPRSAVGNMSGNRCESGCRSRGREFDPGPVPYFRGD